jgi:hypothetical protein
MSGGSVESLLAAIAITDEIVAARRLMDGTTAPTFSAGSPQTTGLPPLLNTDLSNVSMGGRLGKNLISVQSNDFVLAAPATSANISGSFAARNRDVEPVKDLSPATGITLPAGVPVAISATGDDFVELTLTGVAGVLTPGLLVTGATSGATAIIKSVSGSVITVGDFIGSLVVGELINQAAPAASGTISSIDLREGAITGLSGGPVTDQNIVVINDRATGHRAADNSEVVFGRLIYGPGGASNPGELTLTAGQQLNFSAGTTTVTVAAGVITTPAEIDEGDIIEGDDGRFYEVVTISGSPNITSFTLPTLKPYVGPTVVNIGGLRRRRFILEFKKIVAGVESAATLPAGTYNFFFPAWFTSAKSNFNALLNSEVPGSTGNPRATTTVEGRVIAATGSPVPAQAGVINEAQNNGVSVAGGNAPYHTVNFLGGGLSSTAAGVLTVAAAAADIGKTVQQVRDLITGSISLTTTTPIDDTLPQISEGHLVGTVTITPTNTNNILMFEFVGWGRQAMIDTIVFHMHIGSTADAFAAADNISNSNAAGSAGGMFAFRTFIVGGLPTVSTTYNLYAGASAGSINSVLYSTARISTFTVTELLP